MRRRSAKPSRALKTSPARPGVSANLNQGVSIGADAVGAEIKPHRFTFLTEKTFDLWRSQPGDLERSATGAGEVNRYRSRRRFWRRRCWFSRPTRITALCPFSYGLTDPPCGVGRKGESSGFIEAANCSLKTLFTPGEDRC